MRRADVVILTAIRLELDAVLKVDAGAVNGSAWEVTTSPNGLPIAFRSFETRRGRPLRIAAAVSPDMGATAALTTLLPLIQWLEPRCIAMCGVCASRRGKTNLGDVVAADRLFFYDTGKEISGGVEGDLNVSKLRDDWKATLEGMDAVAQFRDAKWFRDRPLSTEQREQRALVALRDALPEPWKVVDPELEISAWQKIVASLRQRKLLAASGLKLTAKGRRAVEDLLIDHMGKLPDPSPAGTFQPFRLHVAPIGSGSRVIENEEIWAFISRSMRKALGLEMEAAALGELAHRLRRNRLDFIVMKGVMDFANRGRDDHFKEFAARASAECLLWFLREHVLTEPAAGFDDLLSPGTLPAPSGRASPSFLLNARHMIVPWHEGGRSEILTALEAWADDPRAVAVRLLHAEGGVARPAWPSSGSGAAASGTTSPASSG
jgi:nucleoside phosphorylase